MTRRNTKPFLAISLVLLLGMSGCTGLFDSDEPYEMVPTDLGGVAKRSIGSPNLEIFSDCDELEIALKQSIEEEARTSLLQAVDEVYYWGGGMWLEGDAEMAMDDAGSATSSTCLLYTSPSPRDQRGSRMPSSA